MKKNILLAAFLIYGTGMAQKAPGGVSANLQIWVKADSGTGTTVDNSQVSEWINQKAGGVNGIATPTTNSALPVYRTAESAPNFNFNPSIEIVSAHNLVTGYKFPLGFPNNSTNALTSYTHHTRINSSTPYRVTFVMNGTSATSNTTNNPGGSQAPWFGTYGSRPRIYNQNDGGTAFFGTRTINSVGTEIPSIYSFYNDISDEGLSYFFDNNAIPFGPPLRRPNSTRNYPGMVLVMDNSRGNSRSIKGDRIGEFILYSETQTPETRQKINSYLAIKYGVTLGDTDNPISYLNSSSTSITTGIVWNANAAYQNNVFGIGRDDNSDLHQRISTSIDANARSILVISTDNNFAKSNTAHTNIPVDKQFTMIGDNGDTTSFSGSVSIAGKTFTRMKRLWKAQDTGDMNCINIRFKTSVPGNTISAPSGGGSLYFIMAEDPDFTVNPKIKKVTYSSSAIDIAVNFKPDSSSNYFTLATLPGDLITDTTASPSPMGISTVSDSWTPTAPNTYLELRSKNLGMVVSRVTTAARTAIVQQKGMLVYDTTLGRFFVSDGTTWRELDKTDTSNEPLICN